MKLQQQADFLLGKYNGMFTTRQARAAQISYTALSRMVEKSLIERVGPGVYADPATFEDEFVLAQSRFSKGIFCNETALFLYEMTDKTPNYLEMNFPQGYNNPILRELRIIPYYQVSSLINLGVSTAKTPYGNHVRVYDVERTMCDIVRPPHVAQDEIIRNAFQLYVKRPQKNLPKLMGYARALRVDKKIQEYLGVLL